jgi:hypothetical protein
MGSKLQLSVVNSAPAADDGAGMPSHGAGSICALHSTVVLVFVVDVVVVVVVAVTDDTVGARSVRHAPQ